MKTYIKVLVFAFCSYLYIGREWAGNLWSVFAVPQMQPDSKYLPKPAPTWQRCQIYCA